MLENFIDMLTDIVKSLTREAKGHPWRVLYKTILFPFLAPILLLALVTIYSINYIVNGVWEMP